MSPEGIASVVHVSWLVLCGMMLLSRFLFQGAGPSRMRQFLDAWKGSRTHRAWGLAALAYGLLLAVAVVGAWSGLGGVERVVAGSLIVVLSADGLLNLVPSWFGHFKERMQDAWVRRHGPGVSGSDRRMFATVNLLLGLASVAVGAAVFLYGALSAVWLLVSGIVALALTLSLVGACMLEMRQTGRSI